MCLNGCYATDPTFIADIYFQLLPNIPQDVHGGVGGALHTVCDAPRRVPPAGSGEELWLLVKASSVSPVWDGTFNAACLFRSCICPTGQCKAGCSASTMDALFIYLNKQKHRNNVLEVHEQLG